MTEVSSPDDSNRWSAGGLVLGIVINLVACLALVCLAIDKRPWTTTVVLYAFITVALVLPFILGWWQQQQPASEEAGRRVLYLASLLLIGFMFFGTVGRCITSVSSVSESDLGGGIGSLLFGSIRFIASPWSLLLAPGLPLFVMLWALKNTSDRPPTETEPGSGPMLDAETARPFMLSALLLVLAAVWARISVAG